MSSAISTDSSASQSGDNTFRPWQFFLLAGMLAATATVFVATGQPAASIVLLSITVVAASFVGLAVYRTLAPLASAEVVEIPKLLAGRTRAALEREKMLVLRSIKELEFDYAMKKVGHADYNEMVGRLRARALGLMRQLEADEGYRSTIEQELSVRLGSARLKSSSIDEPKSSPNKEPKSTPTVEPVNPFACDACGVINDSDARFCKKCGNQLEGAE